MHHSAERKSWKPFSVRPYRKTDAHAEEEPEFSHWSGYYTAVKMHELELSLSLRTDQTDVQIRKMLKDAFTW